MLIQEESLPTFFPSEKKFSLPILMQVPELDSSHGQSNSRHVGNTLILIYYILLSEKCESHRAWLHLQQRERIKKTMENERKERVQCRIEGHS